jgi:hypothetical protein
MKLVTTFARAAGLGLCVVAFSGTALADPGNGNGNGPEGTPPGQEKKAEEATQAPAPAPAAQSAQGQEHKAEDEKPKADTHEAKATKQAAKATAKTETKSAKPAKPAKASGSYKSTSSGNDLKRGVVGGHKHTICHATGSAKNPYVRITPSVSGVFHGHLDHQDDRDIVPLFTYKGVQYSQNWDAAGQAIFAAGCAAPAAAVAPTTHVTPPAKQEKTSNCPTTVTTTERVLIGVKHYTGAVRNGERKYVVISPSQKSAHFKGKHEDDEPLYETRTVTRVASGESCATVSSTNTSNTSNTSNSSNTTNTQSSVEAAQVTAAAPAIAAQAPVGGVAGVVSPAPAAKSDSPGGVLGAVASAPAAVADTATSATLPFTGFPLWIVALIGVALLLTGLVLRRRNSLA